MIVGKGLLAKAFEQHFGDNRDVVIFASGVSNSLETRLSEFAREELLLRELLDPSIGRFVYFGSCGAKADESELTAYMRHKLAMESLVLSVPHGLVLRLPQVVSRAANPHTLTNFLRDRIVTGEHFTVWSRAERNLIDIDDIVDIAVHLIRCLPQEATAVSVASLRSLLMPEIIQIFERVLGRSANCTYQDAGAPLSIDTTVAREISLELGIELGNGYAERIINKYYATDSVFASDKSINTTQDSTRTTSS
ncbi:NAD-dependent epimerase/dehydratase family protein [Rhodanobacter aciditrophus]|uniref:NAD-dependent epimerase/dehydratase family protein n=1 Tax=Rhodanobacter aciditrophus TaxID=1623218 RepID=UPI003CF5B4B1